MEWWVWLVLGIVLLALELLTPGALFLMFFGAGAIAVGLLSAIGLGGPLWVQILLFALLSLAALVTLRRLLLARLHSGRADKAIDQLIGETALALEDIPVDGMGKAELRGSTWNVRNVGMSPLSRGQRCMVARVEGLTLWVYEE